MAITDEQIDRRIAEGVSAIRRQVKTELLVEETHERLFGNHQPGIVKEHEGKFNKLFAWKNKATGALIVIGALVSGIGLVKTLELFGVL